MIFASTPGEEAIPLHLPMRKDHGPKQPAQVYPFTETRVKPKVNWRAKLDTLVVGALCAAGTGCFAAGVIHYLNLPK